MSQESPTNYGGQIGFCVGTGRCGTTLFARLCDLEPTVAASHERDRLGATFHMYCKWNSIPVDHEGFLATREELVRADLERHAVSIESSALLSHSIIELHSRFEAKLVLLIRDPAETVASFAARGWFVDTPTRHDASLPPSFRAGEKMRHFLGRNIPIGDEFERWKSLTQIGRIAWFWNARNQAILNQFEQLPSAHYQIQRIEDFDHEAYCRLAKFFGWVATIEEPEFGELAAARLNTGPSLPRKAETWSKVEVDQFKSEVDPVASTIGYESML